MPESSAEPQALSADPGGGSAVMATADGDEVVTIYGVRLSGFTGWTHEASSAADFGFAIDAGADEARGGAVGRIAGRGSLAGAIFAPDGMQPDAGASAAADDQLRLPAGAGHPGGRGGRDVRPIIAALIDPNGRQQPASGTDGPADLPTDLPAGSGPLIASAAPWTLPHDTLDTANPDQDGLPTVVAAADPVGPAQTPHKRGGDWRPGGAGASPADSPRLAAAPKAPGVVVLPLGRPARAGGPGVAGAAPVRVGGGSPFGGGGSPLGGGSPFDWGGPLDHMAGPVPGTALDDPIAQLFDGPGPGEGGLPDGGHPPGAWGSPFSPSPGIAGIVPISVDPAAVPEPGSLLLLALALLGLGMATARRSPLRDGRAWPRLRR